MVGAAGTGILISVLGHRGFDLPKQDIVFALLYGLVGFVIGAKVVFLITSLPILIRHSLPVFSSYQAFNALVVGGFSLVGGFAGGGVGGYLYCRQYGISWWALVNTALPGVPPALALARVGCFAAGCCHGIPCSFGLVMNHAPFAPHGVPLFPTQLIEAGGNVLFFFVLIKMKKREDGRMLYVYLICFCILRLFLEQFRWDARLYTYFLISTTSWFCVVTLVVSIICLIRLDKKNFA